MISRSHVRPCLVRPFAVAFLAVYIGLSGCGPELTTPGKTDLSGTWFASGPAAGLTSVYVTITQASDGSISGVFTADGSPSLQFCPPTPICTIGGTATGSNTVLHVFIELQDAGAFTGQVVSVNTMRGAMSRGSVVHPVEFTRP